MFKMTAGNKCQATRRAMESRLSTESHISQSQQQQQRQQPCRGDCKDYVSLNKNVSRAPRRKPSQPRFYVYTRFGDRKPVVDDPYLYNRRSRMGRSRRGTSYRTNTDYDGRRYPAADGQGQRMSRILEPVPQMQRQDVIDGLKTNWRSLQTEYQKLPIINDTRWRKQKKEELENRLAQLEHDIELMEICRHLYTERTQAPRRLPPLEAQRQSQDYDLEQPYNNQRQSIDQPYATEPRQSVDHRQSYGQRQSLEQERQSLEQERPSDQRQSIDKRQSVDHRQSYSQRQSLEQERQSIDKMPLSTDQKNHGEQKQSLDQVLPEENEPAEHRNSSTVNKVKWLDRWRNFY